MDSYYNAKDLMDILKIGRTKAYSIIRTLNSELESKGFLTVSGKISKKYFAERFYQ